MSATLPSAFQDSLPDPARSPRPLWTVPTVALPALLLCALGVFVLTGWALGSEPMARVLPGSTAMAINTAAMFLLAGIGLLLAQAGRFGRTLTGLSAVLIALPLAILAQHAFDVDLGIDWAAIHARVGDGHAKPGRTAPNACIGFLCAGMVLLSRARGLRGRRWQRLRLALGTLALALGATAFLGYELNLEALYRIASYNQMAALTALGMVMTGFGLVALASHEAAAYQLPGTEARRITWRAAGLLVLFALATSVTAFAVLKKAYEEAAAENLWQTGRTSAAGIATLLDQSLLLADSVAGRPVLVTSLTRLAADPDHPGALDALQREEQSFLALGFTGVRILSPAGQVLGSAGRVPETPMPLAAPLHSRGGRAWLMWNGGFVQRTEHPVTDRGVVVGRLVLDRALPELTAFVTDAGRVARTSDLVLCTREDQQLACFPSRFYPQPQRAALFDGDGAPASPAARALLGGAGTVALKDARGVSVLAAYVPVPRHPLGLVQKLDTQEFYLPLRDNLAALVAATLAFIIAGTLFMHRWVEPVARRIASERQRMQAILDHSHDAFIAVDARGRIVQWNSQAEQVFGWSAADAVGRDVRRLLGAGQPWAEELASGTQGAHRRRIDATALHASGRALPVELSIAPYDEAGAPATSVFLRDLTQEQEAQRQLEEARSALGQAQKLEAIGKLTGGVAHDFNNVLQVVASNLQLLQPHLAHAHEARRLADAALHAVERGAKLSSQLLAFARRQPLQPVPFSVNRHVQAMDELLRRSLGEHVELETVLAAGLWTTLADPHQLENVILNLAINARDAMPDGGKLTIETANAVLDEAYTAGLQDVQPGQYVMLAVSDTGVGMPPEVLAHAFEPFFTTKPEGKGTGLGLSMAYGFAKQSGGHIRIYSEVGHGTTVRLYLPRSHEAEVMLPPRQAAHAPRGTETVLVVEDDLAVQAVAVGMLRALGYQTLCASDAESALRLLQQGARVDLLFTDVVMPGPLRSPELARKAAEILPDVAVLYTSGYTQNAIVHGGRLDPGVELLSKPYRQEELARKVRKVLDARPRRQTRAPAGPAPKAAAPGAATVPEAAPATSSQPLRVLMVEDEDDLRSTAHELLCLLGVDAVSVDSAEAAERALQSQSFDVLITDVSLPGHNGVVLAQRAVQQQPKLRVVFASGYGEPPGVPEGLRYELLTKPYGIEQLQALLQREG